MKILYAIQGTGNGHISRASEMLHALNKRAHVDVLISGMHTELTLDHPVKYCFNGLGFKFGKSGGIDYLQTWWHGDVLQLLKDIRSLDLSGYDLIINDFEPISAWAAKQQYIPCIGLSNQCILLDKRVPKPKAKKYSVAKSLLRHYAPVDSAYGYYYKPIDDSIFTPVIRSEVRKMTTSTEGGYVVYLPFYNDQKIIKCLSRFCNERWTVFSKHSKRNYTVNNIRICTIGYTLFNEALANAQGVICGAGFTTTSEALYLGKKLMVIPMKNQFEQECNAMALQALGITTIKSLKKKWQRTINDWLLSKSTLEIRYRDNSQAIVDQILTDFARQTALVHSELHEAKLSLA